MKSVKIGLVALSLVSAISVIGAKEAYVDQPSKASMIYEMRQISRSVVFTDHASRDYGIVSQSSSPERPVSLAN